jgi:POT family proton-dependent oligopeptide transporter
MMGIAFLTLFVSNNLIGWVGRFYEQMSPTVFWTMHAGIAATGGVLVMVFGRRLTRALHVEDAQPMRPSAMTLEVER